MEAIRLMSYLWNDLTQPLEWPAVVQLSVSSFSGKSSSDSRMSGDEVLGWRRKDPNLNFDSECMCMPVEPPPTALQCSELLKRGCDFRDKLRKIRIVDPAQTLLLSCQTVDNIFLSFVYTRISLEVPSEIS